MNNIRLGLLVLLFILVVWGVGHKYAHPRNETYKRSAENIDMQSVILELLGVLDPIMKKHKIQYWLMGGSMLGSMRHGGVIPWDDDIDIGVWSADVPRIKNAVFEEMGDRLIWWPGDICNKIFFPYRYDTVIDIFPMDYHRDKVRGNVITFANKTGRNMWPDEYFTEEEFGTARKKYKFDRFAIEGPNKPCSYLDRAFPMWDSRGYDYEQHSKSAAKRLRGKYAPKSYIFDSSTSRQRCECDYPPEKT